MPPGPPRAPAARDRGAPAAAAPESSGRRDGDASTSSSSASSSPSVPVVTRAPPPGGTAEVVIRYAYPGVRFSQAKVVIARVPAGAPGESKASANHAESSQRESESESESLASVAVTGAQVLAAIAADGVDVRRWRARVALDHERATSGIHRSPEPELGAAAAEDEAAFTSRASRKTFQTHVGWRALAEDDRIEFREDSVGLLVQLEDGLVATLGTADDAHDARFPRREEKGGGGRRGAKARSRRRAAEAREGEASGQTVSAERAPGLPTDARIEHGESSSSGSSTYRASSYWKSPTESSAASVGTENGAVPGNNPYAGARSLGTTIWPRDPNGASAGYFGVGVVRPKHEANVGTLWRSAWQLGAGFIFTVGTRFKYEASDTTQAHKQIPLFKHADWESFARSSPHGAVWVAVEMGSGSVPLQDFVHPPRAVYVLGSEDNGLNRPIVEACQCHVSLPKWVGRSASYNVATAGALVMYDRLVKRLADGAYDARSDE